MTEHDLLKLVEATERINSALEALSEAELEKALQRVVAMMEKKERTEQQVAPFVRMVCGALLARMRLQWTA
jgi:hypothetical protein